MTQSPVFQPGRSATQTLVEFASRHEVLIGTGCAIVASATVGAAVLVFSSASATPKPVLDSLAAPAAISAPAVSVAQPLIVVADRWYQDTTTPAAIKPGVSAPPVRDAWYMDDKVTPAAFSLSEQARDRWYRDAGRTPSVDASRKSATAESLFRTQTGCEVAAFDTTTASGQVEHWSASLTDQPTAWCF